jgi:hypothetical protein
MEMQQMMEFFWKELRADREDFMARMEANRKKDKEEREADRKTAKEEILKKMDEYQAKTDAILLALQVMETSHREMVAEATLERNMEMIACQEMEERPEEEQPTSLDRKPEAAQQEEVPIQDTTVMPVREPEEELMPITQKETIACQEMEACLDEEKPTSVDRKPEAAEEEVVLKEDAIVQLVKRRKRRYRSKKQAAGRRREPKKLTRGDCGSWMQLAAACRKVSCHAAVAWHKRNIFRKSWTHGN